MNIAYFGTNDGRRTTSIKGCSVEGIGGRRTVPVRSGRVNARDCAKMGIRTKWQCDTLSSCRVLMDSVTRERGRIQCQGLGIAGAAAGGVLGLVRQSIDPIVLASTTSASFKLLIICMVVRWLSDNGKIPSNTSVVLAQVSFQLLIPCMLFIKVVSILSMQSDPMLLIGMGVAAVSQICVGAVWGSILSPLIDEKNSNAPTIFGFQNPFRTDRASTAVAEATSKALGVPYAKQALLPRPEKASVGFKSLISVACAFQNSFTLPAVFLLSLLPAALADRAIAYLGLYLLAWSPCLWSLGLYLIQRGYQIDADPQQNGSNTSFSWLQMLKGTLNPPVLAVFFAACLGMMPLGQALFSPTTGSIGAPASLLGLPLELSIVFYAFQNIFEVVEMLGEGTLPIQTLVLAASLLQPADGPKIQAKPTSLVGGVLNFFKSGTASETRALIVLSVVRFILSPISVVLLFRMFSSFSIFQPLLSDPILLFVIAVQSVMPSAQNLLIALQLSPLTQGAAPGLAKLLVKLYALAIIPVTLWVTGFFISTGTFSLVNAL